MPVTVDTSLPLHDDRDRTWDGDAARSNMAASCGGRGEELDVSCMGQGFLWRDPDADDQTLGAYKLPVADIFNGAKHIVWSGVTSAAGYLDATSGMSETDRDRARGALSTIYGRFRDLWDDESIRPPWEEGETAAGSEHVCECTACGCGGMGCNGCCAAKPVKRPVDTWTPMLTAAASDGTPWAPPRAWFDAADPAPLTITPEGRVYGDLARFGQRHIGADGHDIYPPRDPDGLYRAFRQRTITLDDGEKIAVGVLTMDTGHADSGIGAEAAVEHYDHTGAIVAAVNIGEDDQAGGRIWLAGALLPDVTDGQRLRLTLSGVSGDWRQTRSRGPLELVAALAVNVPGFPVPAVEIKDGRELALVAAGAVKPSVDHTIGSQLAAGLAPELMDTVVDRLMAGFEQREQRRKDDERAAARLAKATAAHEHMVACARAQRARRAQAGLVAASLRLDECGGSGKA